MEKISVALAGPWWTHLTYLAPKKYAAGTRVRVPVGNGSRVGLVMPDDDESDYAGALREISAVIDERPILPGFILPLIQWFKDTYLCGTGTAMKTLLPANFLQGDGFVSVPEAGDASASEQIQERGGGEFFQCSKPVAQMDSFIYEPIASARWKRYEEMLSDGLPSLICFPQYDSAKAFAKKFDGLALFPKSGAAAEWRAWSRLLTSPGCKIVLGGQTAAVAPLPGIARIIVEDESSNAWLTMRPPVFNVRSLLAKRARIEGTSLVLGGRMPSSRAYIAMERRKKFEPSSSAAKVRQNNFIFVDMKLAYSPSVKGLHDSLAVSEPLVRESEAAFSRGSWALWILDRRGYAGEIICEECGSSLRCPKCRGAMRWEASAGRLACVACGFYDSIPENCPNCGDVTVCSVWFSQ